VSKHTPGPWIIDETKALGAYGVWTDYATHPGHDGAWYGSLVCSVYPHNRSDVPREQRDANARLIAAAPDLLAACKAAARWIAGNTPMVDSSDPILGPIADEADRIAVAIHAAIRKAEGGAA
jgi:hypothetical protein